MSGAASYAKGARFERLVQDDLEASGWPVVVRSSASKSPVDLVAVRCKKNAYKAEVWLIQCKTLRKYLRKAERVVLWALAARVGATPVLAYKGLEGIVYEVLT